MKKGKVFGKRHIVTASLVLCLAAAVWLNMRFSSLDGDNLAPEANGNLGDGQYISDENLGVAVQTSAGVDKIKNSRTERNQTREKSLNDLKSISESNDADDEAKSNALQSYTKLSEWSQNEVAIETVIKSKGFDDALAIISEESVTVIVPSEGLLTSQTLQIQDAVTSQIKIDLEKIKIITVK